MKMRSGGEWLFKGAHVPIKALSRIPKTACASTIRFREARGLEIVCLLVDQTPIFTLTGGIFKDAPHPNATKLYLTWFLAREERPTCRRLKASNRSRLTKLPTTIGSS